MKNCKTILFLMLTLTIANRNEAANSRKSNKWEDIRQGNSLSRVQVDQDDIKLEVWRDGMIGRKKGLEEGDHFSVTLKLKDSDLPKGSSCGLFINTAEGALIQFTKARTEKGLILRFQALAGNKVFGNREFPCPDGDLTLILARVGQRFSGFLKSAPGKLQSISFLDWPNLKVEGITGMVAEYRANQGPAKHIFTCESLQIKTLEYYHWYAETLHRHSAGQDMVDMLDEALMIFGERADFYFSKYWAYHLLDNWPEQEACLKKVIELDPQHGTALNNLAYDYIQRDIFIADAVDLAKRALELNPDKAPWLDTLGWGLFKLGKIDEARETLEKCIVKDREQKSGVSFDFEAIEHLAELYRQNNQLQKARDLYLETATEMQRRLSNNVPFGTYDIANLGWMYDKAGKYEEAEKELSRAEKLMRDHGMYDREDMLFYEKYGDFLLERSKPQAARQAYSKAEEQAQALNLQNDLERIKKKNATLK